MSSPINRSFMDSPQRDNIILSPSKNDIDFLHRKIHRLEEDYSDASEELQKVKNRLRKAQDFEIKYDLLMKQKSSIQSQSVKKSQLIIQYETQIKELQMIVGEGRKIQYNLKAERQNLLREAQQWRSKFYQVQQLSSKINAQQQYKMSEKLFSQLQVLKKCFSNQQQDYKKKIRILEINLLQKQTIQSTIRQKHEKNTDQKDNQIQRLQNNMKKLRQQHLIFVQEKNNQLIQVSNKFQNLFIIQIQKLKNNQSNNSQKFSVQIQGLRALILLKNNQIQQLIKQLNDSRDRHIVQKQQYQKQVSLLRQKIYQVQRENQLELYNMKERLINIHQVDTANMKQNFEKLNLTLQANNRQLQLLISSKDRQIFTLNKKLQEKIKQFSLIIGQKDKLIEELNEKLRLTEDRNAKQMDNLHSSFHKITTQKGALSTQYHTTQTFLSNQITKLTSSNNLKNQQILDLHMQIAQIKKNFSQHIKDLQKKWRSQRKQRQQQRDRQRNNRETIEDQFREKEQKWRHRERMIQREKEKQERQKIKLKIMVQQLEKNLQRLTKHIKDNQDKLKDQMQKNQSTFVQAGNVRRELTGQLERQKGQLQTMKKMQLDQVHRQYQIQITRLTNQNQKLLNQLTQLRIKFQNIEDQYKAVKHTNKNIDRITKEKMVEYQRKMSALNAEINLTQNLYQSFLSAKTKVISKSLEQ